MATTRRPWAFFLPLARLGGSTATVTWVTYYDGFKYVASEWSAGTVWSLLVYMKAVSGTARARLYDNTVASAVTGSTITTASASLVHVESGALTLTDAHHYLVQFGDGAGDDTRWIGVPRLLGKV